MTRGLEGPTLEELAGNGVPEPAQSTGRLQAYIHTPQAEYQLARWREETVLAYLKEHPPTPLWVAGLWVGVLYLYTTWLVRIQPGATHLHSPWLLHVWPLAHLALTRHALHGEGSGEAAAMLVIGVVVLCDTVLLPSSRCLRHRRSELHAAAIGVVAAAVLLVAVALGDTAGGIRVGLAGVTALWVCAAFRYPPPDNAPRQYWPTTARSLVVQEATWSIARHRQCIPLHRRWVRAVLGAARRLVVADAAVKDSTLIRAVKTVMATLAAPSVRNGHRRALGAVNRPPPLPTELWLLILELMVVVVSPEPPMGGRPAGPGHRTT
eukprot:m.107248 g.107248  ORF g.107248 m.107248 type:complete len:322 (-) comp12743_c0_seq1:279-1244(-)